ncbi:hypothetical protein QCE48_06070 [Caballeronia sp. LZ024]|nr:MULTISPECIES: hypothetical protein [unclassified Caballeronia]MDR5750355.1 hypothetical protein [Caballeronia sp. LZ024]MDR5842613.1 hypothetical protein [Caballeronia sp. LZ031]
MLVFDVLVEFFENVDIAGRHSVQEFDLHVVRHNGVGISAQRSQSLLEAKHVFFLAVSLKRSEARRLTVLGVAQGCRRSIIC